MNDKAIEYEAILYQANRIIKNLQRLGINTAQFEQRIKQIDSECKKDVDTSLQNKHVNEIGYGGEAFLIMDYTKAISELEDLITDLDKYEVYIRIASFGGVLRSFINDNRKDPVRIEEMRKTLLNHLSCLKLSGTLPYNDEKQVVEDIYSLAFEFIKEEIKVTGSSKTLDILKNDIIHSMHLDKCITGRLEEINLKDPKYKNVATIKKRIDLGGYKSTYLNESLIKAMVEVDSPIREVRDQVTYIPPKEKDTRIVELTNMVEKYLGKMKDMPARRKIYEDQKRRCKRNYNEYLKELLIKLPAFLLTASLTLGLFGGAGFLAKVGSTTKKYKGSKTTYLEETNETIDETLYVEKGSVNVIEISPYQKGLDGRYTRATKHYDASSYGDMPISFFLDLDTSTLPVTYIGEQTKDSLDTKDLYEETIRAVEKTLIDLNDSKNETNWRTFLGGLVGLESIALLIWVIFFALYGALADEAMIFDQAADILYIINELRNSNKPVKEAEKELKKLKELSYSLFVENKDKVKELTKLIPLLENDPNYQKEVMDAKVVLQRLKENGITR